MEPEQVVVSGVLPLVNIGNSREETGLGQEEDKRSGGLVLNRAN